jgi:hypothetical protein
LNPGVVSAPTQTVTVTQSGSGSAKAKAPRAGGGGTDNSRIYSSRSAGGGGAPLAPKPSSGTVAMDGLSEGDAMRSLSPEEQKRAQLKSRFHPSVLAVIDRLKAKNAVAGPDEVKFIRNGKAEVQIWLTEKSDETIAALKALGFEVVLDPKSAKLVIGRLPIEKLSALAELKSVRYVAPQI